MAAATGLVLGQVPAIADDVKTPGSAPLTDPRFTAQAGMQRIADQIRPLAEAGPGFGGISFDQATKRVVLRWKGEVPGQLTALTRALKVDVRKAAFSKVELDQAARAFTASPPAAVAAAWTRVGPLEDMSGLEYAVSADVVPAEAHSLTVGAVPVRLAEQRSQPVAAQRWADTAPFWGGAAIDRPVNGGYQYCTTAFAVRRPNGQEGMLTAYHCGANADWHAPFGDAYVGRSESGSFERDATVITGGGGYGAAIYTGAHNAQAVDGRPVAGAGNPDNNSYVFASGSWSGASTLRVVAVNQYIRLEGQGVVGPTFMTRNEEGRASVGQGDSGGPTASPFNGDVGRLSARGIISAVDPREQGQCQGMDEGRLCSRVAFHVNINEATAALGVSVKTG